MIASAPSRIYRFRSHPIIKGKFLGSFLLKDNTDCGNLRGRADFGAVLFMLILPLWKLLL